MSNANNYLGGRFVGQDIFFVDGDQTFAEPIGIPRLSFPMEGDSKNSTALAVHYLAAGATDYASQPPYEADFLNQECFIIEQDFKVAADWFAPLDMNTPYDSAFWHDYVGPLPLVSAILVAEGPQQDIGGGFVKWTRTYVYMNFSTQVNPGIPAMVWNDYESIPFTFPGLSGDLVLSSIGANPFPDEVEARVERIFFVDDGVNRPERLLAFYPFVSFLGPAYPSEDNFLNGDSSPTQDDYLVNWVPMGDEIVVRPSILRRWRGNIYELVTYYAPAE